MRIMLSTAQMTTIALNLLKKNGGFVIDEFGCTPEGELWAVSVGGKEQQFVGLPTVGEIEQYILHFLLADGIKPGVFFGGWTDEGRVADLHGVTYLGNTILFSNRREAIRAGIEQKQSAIYNLKTGELYKLPTPLCAPSPPSEGVNPGLKLLVRDLFNHIVAQDFPFEIHEIHSVTVNIPSELLRQLRAIAMEDSTEEDYQYYTTLTQWFCPKMTREGYLFGKPRKFGPTPVRILKHQSPDRILVQSVNDGSWAYVDYYSLDRKKKGV